MSRFLPLPSPSRHRCRVPAVRAGLACAVLGMLCGSCLTPREAGESAWPPEDFHLRVRAIRNAGDGVPYVAQEMLVWQDGTVVYRRVADPEATPAAPPPLAAVVAYRLRSESVRQLSRMLYRARLFDEGLALQHGDPPSDESEQSVVIVLDGFAERRIFTLGERVYGPPLRAIHVVNAFLPEGERFALRDMTGQSEPPHVAGVPKPEVDLEAALAYHLMLRERLPEEDGITLDVIALHLARGDRDLARRELELLEEALRGGPFVDDPELIESLARLRRRLESGS